MATSVSPVAVRRTDRDIYLDRVREMAPLIEESGNAIERNRRLTPDLRSALYEAGLFRLLLERRFNGAEVMPSDFSAIIEEVAKHDASTAWCLCQANGCAMTASFLNDDVANKIWGNDPQGVLAWGPGKSLAAASRS